MSLHILARRIQRNVEDYGWWVTAKKSLANLLAPVYKRQVYRIYRKSLEVAQPQEESETNYFTFKILNPDDTCVIRQVENLVEFLRGELAEAIAAGDLCLAALHKDRLAGFNLITFGEVFIPVIEMKRVFRQGEAWSRQIAVHKDFRKRGLGSQLRYRVFDELRKRGIKRFYGGTLRSNVPALKLTRRVGFEEFVDVHYIKVFNSKTWRFRRVRK